MTDSHSKPDFDVQRAATALFGSIVDASTDPLLKAQAELLIAFETTVTEWLHRRHEDVVDTQRLVARLKGNTDPADILKAQQEWVSGAFHRLFSDAAAFQAATLRLMEGARSWVEKGVQAADRAAPPAAAAPRNAARTLRVASRRE